MMLLYTCAHLHKITALCNYNDYSDDYVIIIIVE